MSNLEIIEEYDEIDMQDVVKMLEKQDDQLILLNGFLALLLLMFLAYGLNLHIKWLSLLHATTKSINQDQRKSEKTTKTKPEKGKIATFVLTKPVMTIENEMIKDQVKLQPKSMTKNQNQKLTKFKKSVVKGIKNKAKK